MAKDANPTSYRPSLAGALFTAVAFCGGCSLLLHADANQCSSDSDCSARGPAFARRVCQAGTCVSASPIASEGGTDAWAGADTSVDTGAEVEARATIEAGPDAAGCMSNADCMGTSPTHPEVACDFSSHACIQLTTDDCPIVTGDYSGATATPIFVGAFGTIPSGAPLGHPSYLNYALAIQEFGIQGESRAGTRSAHALGRASRC